MKALRGVTLTDEDLFTLSASPLLEVLLEEPAWPVSRPWRTCRTPRTRRPWHPPVPRQQRQEAPVGSGAQGAASAPRTSGSST